MIPLRFCSTPPSFPGNTTTRWFVHAAQWVETKCVRAWPLSMLPAGGKATREARGVMSANGNAETAAATFNYIRLTFEAMTARSDGLPLTSGPAFPSAPSPALPFSLWHLTAIGLKRWEETMCG